jgi:membrane protein required for colicin V production
MNLDSSHFNAFDMLLLVTLLFSMIIGFVRGFVRESLGLGAWGGALWIMVQDYEWPKKILSRWIHDPMILKVVSSFFIFCSTLVILLALAQWISHYIHSSIAKSIDRSLGIVFGFIRGLAVMCFVYLGSLFFIAPQHQPSIIQLSKSHSHLNRGALFIAPFIPSFFKEQEVFKANLKELTPPQHSPEGLSQDLSSPRPEAPQE